jgi:hypothetical protein
MKTEIKRVEHPMARTPVVEVGSCVVQESDGGFFVMLPDGQVSFKPTKEIAEKHCCAFFRKTCPKNEISFGKIKWTFAPKTVEAEVLQPT